MKDRDSRARELCEAGLQKMWQGDVEPALEFYVKALELAQGEELRELITIRKAEALIAADRPGEEVAALPQIVMRRRSPRHVYMAATVLMRRYVELEDRRRAIFYGEIGRKAAEELGDPMARASVLNGLGIAFAASSDFTASLDALEEAYDALLMLDQTREDVSKFVPTVLGNIGGVKVVNGETNEGIRLLEQALPFLDDDYLISEVMLDLCLGYSDLEDYETAEAFGIRGLDLAAVPRQVRNGNHLLARIALAQGREDDASDYIDVVAAYYPEYPAVKELLMRFDLAAVVNWKA
jgi:tetratricopeptide (TPR) repeat protein